MFSATEARAFTKKNINSMIEDDLIYISSMIEKACKMGNFFVTFFDSNLPNYFDGLLNRIVEEVEHYGYQVTINNELWEISWDEEN